jgi:hypothetical protein
MDIIATSHCAPPPSGDWWRKRGSWHCFVGEQVNPESRERYPPCRISLRRRRFPGNPRAGPREAVIPENETVIHHFLPGFMAENELQYLAVFQRSISS